MANKIGILTWHYYPNFGSQLQTYALVKTIRDFGMECRVVNYHSLKFGQVSTIRKCVEYIILHIPDLLWRILPPGVNFPGIRFRRFFKQTKIAYDAYTLNKICKDFDILVCGSDQIWAPNVYNPIYMLSFANSEIRKVSYAASIGLNDIPENLVQDYRKNLSKFNSISVRESKGKEIIAERLGLNATVTLDPTLLVSQKHWRQIARPYRIKEKYIFCYLLRKNHNYAAIIKKYADGNHLKIIAVSSNMEDSSWATTLKHRNLGAPDFLGLIENAERIFTDSYHGTIFSMLFHKDFITFERFSNDSEICQNSRLEQLKKNFSINDRIVRSEELTELPETTINWVEFDNRVSILKKSSIQFLKQSVE